MADRMRFEHVQHLFAKAILNHDVTQHFSLFKGTPEHVERRLTFYRHSIFAHQEKALAVVFPVLKKLMEPSFFADIAHAYSSVYPSQSGNLYEFGTHFPHFLKQINISADNAYYADLASLEWAVHTSRNLRLVDPIYPEAIAKMEPDVLETMLFSLHPACTLLSSNWSIGTLWLAYQHGTGIASPVMGCPESMVIFRHQWQVKIRLLSTAEYAALMQFTVPCQLIHALNVAFDFQNTIDIPAMFRQWLLDGVLISSS